MMTDLSEAHRRLLVDAATALGAFLFLVVPMVALGLPDWVAVFGWSTLMVVSLAFRGINPLLAGFVSAEAGPGWGTRSPPQYPQC